MKSLRRILREAFDGGAVLAVGLGCLFLYKQQYFPNVFGPLSYGILSVGALGFARYVLMDYNTTKEDADYRKLLMLLEERKSEIQANHDKLEELRSTCESFMAMREILEGWRRDPSLVGDKVTILEELLKSRDKRTSLLGTKGSTQCKISDMPAEQGAYSPSQRGTDTGSEDVGETAARNLENEPRVDVSEKVQEEVFQKLLEDVLKEVAESFLEEKSEKVLQEVSHNVRKEIYERIKAEIPEHILWEMSEKSIEDILEKAQKKLLEWDQDGTFELTRELLQDDVPEKEISENVQEVKLQTDQVEISKTEKVSEGDQKEIFEKVIEAIRQKKLDKETENFLEEILEIRKVNEPEESPQLKSQNMDDKVKKQQENGTIEAELQKPEQEAEEKLEMEIAESLLEPESEIIAKDG